MASGLYTHMHTYPHESHFKKPEVAKETVTMLCNNACFQKTEKYCCYKTPFQVKALD